MIDSAAGQWLAAACFGWNDSNCTSVYAIATLVPLRGAVRAESQSGNRNWASQAEQSDVWPTLTAI
jgi:hypothetical protein